jgi:hypothetical protein
MALMFDDLIRKPIPLDPVERSMSWGSETWLNGTQGEGPASISGEKGLTLAELLREHPEALGRWARLLFGDDLPIFTKFLRTRFPPVVHAGFCRSVDRGAFLLNLAREQSLLRRLYAALSIADERAFKDFQEAYERWAIAEALGRWASREPAPGEAFSASVRAFVRREVAFDLPGWLAEIKEIDLEEESGNLLLMAAGLPHAIFGLSHQTHPLDHSRGALQALFARLRRLALAGASEECLADTARDADLRGLRTLNTGPPKNEAWLPLRMDGKMVLVEPQQTSNVTYSFADFYTPFAWKGGLSFRKGNPVEGLTDADLEAFTQELDFASTPVDNLRRRPRRLGTRTNTVGAEVFALVDEPDTWPFFTAWEVRISGSRGRSARWSAPSSRGAFAQFVAVDGMLRAEGAFDPIHVDPSRPVFVPATLEGPWSLVSEGKARVLLFGVPTPGFEENSQGGQK